MPSAAGSVSLRNFWARRVPEAAGRRKVISPRTAPPATTVYHTSESAAGTGWEEISKAASCPATWESTFCRQVFQASHQLRRSRRSSGTGFLAGPLGTVVSELSVIGHLRVQTGLPAEERRQRGRKLGGPRRPRTP